MAARGDYESVHAHDQVHDTRLRGGVGGFDGADGEVSGAALHREPAFAQRVELTPARDEHDDATDVARHWALDREFAPAMASEERDARHRRWQRAVERSRDWERP